MSKPCLGPQDSATAAASADASASAAPSSVGPVVRDTSSVQVDEVAPPSSDVVSVPDGGVDGASTSAAPLPTADMVASASVPASSSEAGSDVDLRDNQLDELSTDSQPASQSVLAGLSVVAPSGDVVACADGPSQIDPPSAPIDC